MAEIGVVFLLFTIGLNFSLPQLHALRDQVLVLGPGVFLIIGLAGIALGRFLFYPPGFAKAMIVAIEYSLALSIGATLALLLAGRSVAPDHRS